MIRINFILCTLSLFGMSLYGGIPEATLKIMPPMNEIYHPVSTTNPEAQKSFNLGLTYIFAFNHDIAFRAFEKASQLDPNLAMAYWGMALALGQNVNDDVTPEREIRCYNYIQQALKLAPNATKNEQDYIKALSVRYTNEPKADLVPLRYHYRDAMKKLVQAYPEDLDGASMYVESILDLDPWKWWTPDFKPKPGTVEAIDVLEFILNRNPEHIGANHYYIHAFEESPYPERALMSAERLRTLLPESGHLLHMPCHIFLLVGDYEAAIETDTNAIAADLAYIKEHGMEGGYPVHYLSHNLYVLSRTYMLQEDYDHAIKAAFEVTEFMAPHYEHMPSMAHYSNVPLEIYLYFHKWKEILDYKNAAPYPIAQAYLHYSRAVAFAELGDLASAQKEKELMQKEVKQLTDADLMAQNPAKKVFELADLLLSATVAKIQKNIPANIDYLNKAIAIQDNMDYDEPPAWFMPVRLSLGAELLKQKKYEEAEAAFKQCLRRLKRNGRSLFGLYLSIKEQGRPVDTYWVEREMANALKHASVPLTLNDL